MWEEVIEVAEAKVISENVLDLEERFREGETMFLKQNHVDEVMEMYQEMHMWEEAIEVAEAKVMFGSERLGNRIM